MTGQTIGLTSYATALPRLRIGADTYRVAWGQCAARGLRRKAFCAYDEDAVTLAVAAARRTLARIGAAPSFDALFLGATSLPYEEKPSAATVLTALTPRRDIRTVELSGSPQAGLQALVAAWEFCAANPGRHALAIAADAPSAPADAPYEHGLGAGAAAFLVGPDAAVARFWATASVSRETFGARHRRRGEAALADLELRTDDVAPVLADLTAGAPDLIRHDRLALGCDAGAARKAMRAFAATEGTTCLPWPEIGDAGAALAPLALAGALDEARDGETVLAVAIGAGASALRLAAGDGLARLAGTAPTLAELSEGGEEVDYIAYLRHRRMLSSRFGGTA